MNRIKNILLVILASLSVLSCREFASPEPGHGYLNVKLSSDDRLLTKDGMAADMVFSLDICRGEEVVNHFDDCSILAAEPLGLLADTYILKAYSNTEADAAWDVPFYTGETEVKIIPDQEKSVRITCTINNVVVSASFDETFLNNVVEYSLVVTNGKASMTFGNEEVLAGRKAYFSVTGTLSWKLTFKNADDKTFTAENSYSDVKAQQYYNLKFSVGDPDKLNTGGAGFKIVVDDSINEPAEFDANIHFGLDQMPTIYTNVEFIPSDAETEMPVVTFPQGNETPKMLNAIAKNGITSYVIRQLDGAEGVNSYSMYYELVDASEATVKEMEAKGITAPSVSFGAQSASIDITKYASKLAKGEYRFEVSVYDIKGHKCSQYFILNVTSNVDAEALLPDVGSKAALLKAVWYGNPTGLGLEYRPAGESEYITIPASDITFDEENKSFSAVVRGLEPLTDYEFRPYSDKDKELPSRTFTTKNVIEALSVTPWGKFSVVRGKWQNHDDVPTEAFLEYREYGATGWTRAENSMIEFDVETRTFVGDVCGLEPSVQYEVRANAPDAVEGKLKVMTLTTETAGTVYNLNFDFWYQDGDVYYPFEEGGPHTWDSANEGAATFIGSSTTPSEGADAVSGKAVRMESKYAVIAFAAGNLYTGDFGEINGKGAILDWGVPFDSRPLALKGYYKYTSKAIDKTGDGMGSYEGQPDKMQIQVFITDWTAPFTVNTLDKQFVDFNADYVIAYGKLESETSYSSYQEFTIPLEYRSLTKQPKYIVISAAASYLGDYFTGGVGSTLWIDEFSLEYNPANLTDQERKNVKYR